jgi:hypothetical protein
MTGPPILRSCPWRCFWCLLTATITARCLRSQRLAHVTLVHAVYGSQFRGSERSGREGLVKSKTVSDHHYTGVNGGPQIGDTLSYEQLQFFLSTAMGSSKSI